MKGREWFASVFVIRLRRIIIVVLLSLSLVVGRRKRRGERSTTYKKGGWEVERADPKDGLPWGKDYGHCPFRVLDAQKMTGTDFYEHCYKVQAPCIVENALKSWPALQKRRWHRKHFMRSFGALKTLKASRSEFPLTKGVSNVELSLGEFLNRTNPKENALVFEFFQEIKGANRARNPAYEALDRDTPTVVGKDGKDLFFHGFQGKTTPYKLLSIGGSGAGIDYHTHGDTFLALLFGRKTWFIYPPGRLPSRVSRTMDLLESNWKDVSWYQAKGPKERPLVCQQKASQVLYLPQLFHHATENQGEAVGVGWQVNLEGDVVERTSRHLLRTRPNNPLALMNLWVQTHGGPRASVESKARHFPFQLVELVPNDLNVAMEAMKQYSVLGNTKRLKSLAGKWIAKLDEAAKDAAKGTGGTRVVATALGTSCRALGYALHTVRQQQSNAPFPPKGVIAGLFRCAEQFNPFANGDPHIGRVAQEYLRAREKPKGEVGEVPKPRRERRRRGGRKKKARSRRRKRGRRNDGGEL